jgi:DNA polymerase-3 subunit epsilon
MPEVSALTGITDAMLVPAPPLGAVLPTLVEFIGGAVLVGHNVRFDVGFLDAALDADERPVIGLHRIDTLALARKLLKEDVDNCRLATLAERFGLDNQPSHRALADALATVDLLHVLLERATGFGVQTLDELLTLPGLAGHPHAAKLRLTARLPRAAGVYLLRDAQEKALFVGRADDIRAEVRGYFASTDGRRIGPMLRQLHSIQHRAIPCPDEATRIEARLIDQLDPRYNRQGTKRSRKRARRATPPEEPT